MVAAILAGAGAGDRLGSQVPKAFVPCAGRPLWEWSVAVLDAVCDRVVFAVPPEYVEETGDGPERVAGGASRSQSVRNALAVLDDADVVVVHDAARPLVTRDLVERCIAEVVGGWDGAIAAARMTDTVKEADADLRVVRTLDRTVLWAIQTPQAFRADALRDALADEDALARATDDAALVEAAGGSVRIVESTTRNFKITAAEDLELAQTLLC